MYRSLDAKQMMEKLSVAMKCQRLSVSFEVVSRCLSHHGQLPKAEYLVATAITRLCPDGQIEVCCRASCMPWSPHPSPNLFDLRHVVSNHSVALRLATETFRLLHIHTVKFPYHFQ